MIPACRRPDGPFAYFRKSRGGQHEISAHAAGPRAAILLDRDDSQRLTPISVRAAGIRTTTTQAWKRGHQGLGIFLDRVRD